MHLNADKAVAVCVQYFLRTLMRLERERYGWSMKEAASRAKWEVATWKNLEEHVTPIEPHHWINICAMLELSDERLCRRMDAFVNINPVLLVSENQDDQLDIFEKTLSSPHLVRSRKLFTLSLAPVREKLYEILSIYVADGDSLLKEARRHGFYDNTPEPPLKPSFKLYNTEEKIELQRNRLTRIVQEKIADEKLEALEDALELIANHNTDEVQRAIRVISMILTDS